MRCIVCHSLSQACSFGNFSKKREGVVTYHKDHVTTSMKKHVTTQNVDVWDQWKIINLQVVVEDGGREKSKQWFGPLGLT